MMNMPEPVLTTLRRGSPIERLSWTARCGGCGWPILWCWMITKHTGQECRNCQLKLEAPK